MSRPRQIANIDVSRAWVRLWNRHGRQPSGSEMSVYLGVSARTVWRYLARLPRQKITVTRCAHCKGNGFFVAEDSR